MDSRPSVKEMLLKITLLPKVLARLLSVKSLLLINNLKHNNFPSHPHLLRQLIGKGALAVEEVVRLHPLVELGIELA